MSKPDQPEHKSPAQQTGEEFGKIKKPQQTDATMQDQDTARGSEVETRNSSNNRGG